MPEEENKKSFIPPHGVLDLQRKAREYVKRAQLLYRDLSHEADDVAAEEYARGREQQAYILKTGSWMDEGAGERIVEEYPSLVRDLEARLAELRR